MGRGHTYRATLSQVLGVPPTDLLGFSQECFYDLEPQAEFSTHHHGATKSTALIKTA